MSEAARSTNLLPRLEQGTSLELGDSMKSKQTKKPTLLAVALQAQIAAVQVAKKILEDAIQAAEDAHYAATRKAEQARRTELIAAETFYDKTVKPLEAAWQKVFSTVLRASFSDTAAATRADRAALASEAQFQQALPLIAAEVPADLPGLAEALALMQKQLRQERIKAGKELAAAHDNSALKQRKKIPAAKRKREQGVAAAKRKLERARRAIEKRFEKERAKIDAQLTEAKAAAQRQFDASGEARKQAWAAYFETTQAASQNLLTALS